MKAPGGWGNAPEPYAPVLYAPVFNDLGRRCALPQPPAECRCYSALCDASDSDLAGMLVRRRAIKIIENVRGGSNNNKNSEKYISGWSIAL